TVAEAHRLELLGADDAVLARGSVRDRAVPRSRSTFLGHTSSEGGSDRNSPPRTLRRATRSAIAVDVCCACAKKRRQRSNVPTSAGAFGHGLGALWGDVGD